VNAVKTTGLMVALMVLFVLIGGLIGGTRGMIFAGVLAFVMNVSAYWFSDRVVLAMYRAREVDEANAPTLYRVVRRLAERADLPMPKVYIIPQAAPNAFATGRDPKHAAVAATQGLMQIMDEEELEGVIAHELSHVRNRDMLIGTIAATLAGAIMILARVAQFAAIFGGGRNRDDEGGNPFALIAIAIFGTMAALLIQMAISRSREYQADASGARLSGNPMGLAHALQRLERTAQRVPMQADPATSHLFIVNPLSGGSVFKLFSTHPPTEERIARLEAMTSEQR
jgi:heat shock protein HtpX